MTCVEQNDLKAALYAPYYRRFRAVNAYPLHTHRDYGEVFWCDKGTCVHIINGREVRLKPGDMVFIRPWDQHSLRGTRTRPFCLMIVCFSWHLYDYFEKRYFHGDSSIYGVNLELPITLHLNPDQLAWARQSFLALHKAPRSQLQIESFLGSLFAKLRTFSNEAEWNESDLPEWLLRALRTIQQPKHFRRGTGELYRLCGRCPEHVTRVFHKAVGVTPGKYINRLRIQHAAALLSGTSQPILDIGMECGFQSNSRFYTCFRKEFGSAPRTYRLRSQAVSPEHTHNLDTAVTVETNNT